MTEEDFAFEQVRPIEQHARIIMCWRNDATTLQMSYHHKEKTWEPFFQEFKNEYFSSSRLAPLFALFKGKRIAFLRFIDREHPKDSLRLCCEIGINMAPEFRGKKLSGRILRNFQEIARKKGYDDIYAEIRVENVISQKAFERSGYRLIDTVEKFVKDTKEYCMIKRYSLALLPDLKKEEKGNQVFIIAEAGSNWRMGTFERDMSMARELIDVAVEAGVDAVKFQTYNPESVYVKNAGISSYLSKGGIKKNIYDVFRDLSMPHEMIPELHDYCKSRNIFFMSTPFSKEDFHAVDPYVQKHKIASYEISHLRLIELIAKSKKPLILSTGASSNEDIDWAVHTFRKNGGKDLTLLQCTAKYPASSDSMNLRAMCYLKKRFGVSVGLSDHSRDPIHAPIAAVALGACVIEKHYTLNNRLPGPDHCFAITDEELKKMVKGIREVELMLGDGIKEVAGVEKELHSYARRGVQARQSIKKGEVFVEGENIDILRPGNQVMGVHPKCIVDIQGKVAKRNISLGEGIQFADWET